MLCISYRAIRIKALLSLCNVHVLPIMQLNRKQIQACAPSSAKK